MPKVSVIVPIFNAEKYLKQCLASIAGQTLHDIEIILINDGSTDGSEDICRVFFDDPRVIYYKKDNEGLAAARQDGIERASGEYIGFVDSDDWVEPDMYEKLYLAGRLNNADVVLCNCFEYSEKKVRMEIHSGAYDKEEILREVLPKTLIRVDENGNRRNIRWSNCLRVYKREMIVTNNIQFDRSFRRCQDLPFTFESMLYAKNFYYLDEFLYHNRQDAGSLSRGYTKNMWLLLQPLIIKVNDLARSYHDADLSELADSTSFFLTLDCIFNEFKTDAPGLFHKAEHIRQILSSDMTKQMIKRFDGKKLNGYYRKVFYRNIKSGRNIKLIADYYYYHSDNVLKRILGKITETKLYGMIRKGSR